MILNTREISLRCKNIYLDLYKQRISTGHEVWWVESWISRQISKDKQKGEGTTISWHLESDITLKHKSVPHWEPGTNLQYSSSPERALEQRPDRIQELWVHAHKPELLTVLEAQRPETCPRPGVNLSESCCGCAPLWEAAVFSSTYKNGDCALESSVKRRPNFFALGQRFGSSHFCSDSWKRWGMPP